MLLDRASGEDDIRGAVSVGLVGWKGGEYADQGVWQGGCSGRGLEGDGAEGGGSGELTGSMYCVGCGCVD